MFYIIENYLVSFFMNENYNGFCWFCTYINNTVWILVGYGVDTGFVFSLKEKWLCLTR